MRPYQTKLVSRPIIAPITLEEAKLHLRVDYADEDSLISSLILAATDYVTNFTERALVPQTWDAYFEFFGYQAELAYPPLISIESIEYKDQNGDLQTLDASFYNVNNARQPGHITWGANLPELYRSWDAVKVRYQAGYAPEETGDSPTDLASGIPDAIKAGIKLVIGDLYQNREGQALVVGAQYTLNNTVKSLLTPYRVNMGV